MKTAGIIAEYNPFHNGHKYHIEETRRITGADYVIAVISGDFVQRGAPAIADKYLRAEAALRSGADLVLELPLFYAAGSAEYFAAGAVALLDKLGAVDALCFGSECGSILPLAAAASALIREPDSYRQALRQQLKKGLSFPKARSLSLAACMAGTDDGQGLLSSPNNILGIEYLKALLKRESPIVPYTVKRKGSHYHSSALPQLAASGQAAADSLSGSASAIRGALAKEQPLSDIRPFLPGTACLLLENALHRSFPIYSNDFSVQLHYKLIQEAPGGFNRYLDITDGLSDKICRNIFRFTDYEGFCRVLKSRDVTYSRLSRGLLHILLNMTKEQMQEYLRNDYITYARILGFCKTSAPLLKKIKKHSSVPMITKLADARRKLPAAGLSMLEQDIQAAHLYSFAAAAKYHTAFINEYARQLVIL